jgi:hypothetical protein
MAVCNGLWEFLFLATLELGFELRVSLLLGRQALYHLSYSASHFLYLVFLQKDLTFC